ncbi:MAG TPA: hypothetical protein VF173_33410 [Thermoanaerobaculia bacterium]|nr:hypothetical protein [Thermoanaerobaculia bacterium]
MKKLSVSKLILKRETLGELAENKLHGVAGGSQNPPPTADTQFQCNPTFLSVGCSTAPKHPPLQG